LIVPSFSEQGLQVMAKPIGAVCNLDCTYCYYLAKKNLYPNNRRWRMTERTLPAYIRQQIEAQPAAVEEIHFNWQGGEPTLLGLGFFRSAVKIQQQHVPPGKRITNALQTNGTLLTDAWCEFLRKNNFLVGISIDGPAELHDAYRLDKRSRPTHNKTERGLKLLNKHGVEHNVLVVVNRRNGERPLEVYRYCKRQGVKFIQFIPLVEQLGSTAQSISNTQLASGGQSPIDLVTKCSVRPRQFGNFLIAIFDEWLRHDVSRVFVQIFDETLAAWCGQSPSLCIFQKHCGRCLAFEHNGDLYSCDHFVEPEYKLGNIHQQPIRELANSESQQQFGSAKESRLPKYCRNCDFRFICNGECPRNRFVCTPEREPGLNYLCEGYRRFFKHVGPVMTEMAEELRHGRPVVNVMHRRNTTRPGFKKQPGSAGRTIGRNAPCFCGSGRKYKQCCGQRI
jgi:uncharacterized protein